METTELAAKNEDEIASLFNEAAAAGDESLMAEIGRELRTRRGEDVVGMAAWKFADAEDLSSGWVDRDTAEDIAREGGPLVWLDSDDELVAWDMRHNGMGAS